jgi:hypothetical protein
MGRLGNYVQDGKYAVFFYKVRTLALLFSYFLIRETEINLDFLESTRQDRDDASYLQLESRRQIKSCSNRKQHQACLGH